MSLLKILRFLKIEGEEEVTNRASLDKIFFLPAWRYNKIIKILKVLYVNLYVKSFRVGCKTNSLNVKSENRLDLWEFGRAKEG